MKTLIDTRTGKPAPADISQELPDVRGSRFYVLIENKKILAVGTNVPFERVEEIRNSFKEPLPKGRRKSFTNGRQSRGFKRQSLAKN